MSKPATAFWRIAGLSYLQVRSKIHASLFGVVVVVILVRRILSLASSTPKISKSKRTSTSLLYSMIMTKIRRKGQFLSNRKSRLCQSQRNGYGAHGRIYAVCPSLVHPQQSDQDVVPVQGKGFTPIVAVVLVQMLLRVLEWFHIISTF